MSLPSFQNIFQSLEKLDTLRENIYSDLQVIRSEQEAILKVVGTRTSYGTSEKPNQLTLDLDDNTADKNRQISSQIFENGPPQHEITQDELNPSDEGHRASAPHTSRFLSVHDRGSLCSLAPVSSVHFTDSEFVVSRPGPLSVRTQSSVEVVAEPRSSTLEIYSTTLRGLTLWPIWSEDDGESVVFDNCLTVNSLRITLEQAGPRAGDELRGGVCIGFFIIRPRSFFRITWDVLSCLMLGYDILKLPLEPFGLPATSFTEAMDMASVLFWSADMYFSFTTGYIEMGVLEMRPGKIAKRYLQSWFALDVSVLILDYFLIFADAFDAVQALVLFRAGKSIRIVRIMRVLRLARLHKISTLTSDLTDAFFTEATLYIFRILKLLVFIVMMNHFLACGWYSVGTQTFDSAASSWVETLEMDANTDMSFALLYTTSLHWSITQFTPASMEVVPCNVFERFYALCVILLGLVAFSSFVSSITSSMTHFREINVENEKQLELIRSYIAQHRLSTDLGSRVQAFFRQSRYKENQKKYIHEANILAFRDLPESLRIELRVQTYLPTLDKNPFFRELRRYDGLGMESVCHCVATQVSLPCDNTFFTKGEECLAMFFIVQGQLDYFQSNVRSTIRLGDSEPMLQLRGGDYLCEMALWLQWLYRGRALATANSELVRLDTQLFHAVARRANAFESCWQYAQKFHQRVADSGAENRIYDVFYDTEDMAPAAFAIQYIAPYSTSTTTIGVVARFFGTRSTSHVSSSHASSQASSNSTNDLDSWRRRTA